MALAVEWPADAGNIEVSTECMLGHSMFIYIYMMAGDTLPGNYYVIRHHIMRQVIIVGQTSVWSV